MNEQDRPRFGTPSPLETLEQIATRTNRLLDQVNNGDRDTLDVGQIIVSNRQLSDQNQALVNEAMVRKVNNMTENSSIALSVNRMTDQHEGIIDAVLAKDEISRLSINSSVDKVGTRDQMYLDKTLEILGNVNAKTLSLAGSNTNTLNDTEFDELTNSISNAKVKSLNLSMTGINSEERLEKVLNAVSSNNNIDSLNITANPLDQNTTQEVTQRFSERVANDNRTNLNIKFGYEQNQQIDTNPNRRTQSQINELKFDTRFQRMINRDRPQSPEMNR